MKESRATATELASALAAALGPDFHALPASGYVAVASAEYGLAAVVDSEDPSEAMRSVAELSAAARMAGLDRPVLAFSKAAAGERKPMTWRDGSAGVDVAAGMARASAGGAPMTESAIQSLRAVLAGQAHFAGRRPSRKLSPYMGRLAEACIEKALAGAPALVAGVEIDAHDMAAPNFMLPALLVDAATSWTVPVVSRGREGGFLVRMRQDRNAILGFTVTDVDASAPLLLFLPMVNLVRRSVVNGECVLDESVRRFQHFLSANGIEGVLDEDVDVRVASTT